MKIRVLLENTSADPALTAEHGLSLYVETQRHKILFDAGQTDAFAENASRMGVDLREVDVAVLSHGHYDHGGGLRKFLALNDRAPVYLSKFAFEPHFNAAGRRIGLDEALADEPRLIRVDGDLRIDEELTLHSRAERRQYFPAEHFGLKAKSGDALLPDDFRHEQYLLIREGARGALLSGCSHAGILNIVHWFEPDALIGGFHFMKLDPDVPKDREKLEAAARELLRHRAMYFTGHCTGERQYRFLKRIMGERLDALSTGRTIEI